MFHKGFMKMGNLELEDFLSMKEKYYNNYYIYIYLYYIYYNIYNIDSFIIYNS